MAHELKLISARRAQPPFHVGVDLGGTNIKVGVVDDLGRVLHHFSIPTDTERGPEDGARRMGQAVLRALDEAGVKRREVGGVGLGSPGTMDIPAGMLIRPHNLPGWENFAIRDRVSHHCGLPVTYANDANAAAYGEFWVGRGRDFHSMVLLTLGTGVGGGIIIGDLSIDGENSHGGELGHIIIDHNDSARMCPCGQRGHLEAYASATGVIARAREALGLVSAGRMHASGGATSAPRNRQPSKNRRPKTSLWPRLDAGEELTPLLLAQEAEKGDDFSLEIILETARYLGIGIVTMLHTIDPNGVVLGGQMTFGGGDSALGRRFLARVKEEIDRRAFPVIRDRIVLDFATLGGHAGFIGVAGVARLAASKAGRKPPRKKLKSKPARIHR
jgi:glucokinase